MFPQSGGRKPFPGKFGSSKNGKQGPPKPKSDFGELEEIGAKPPMGKKPNFMADGGMPPGGAPPPPHPGMQAPGMDQGMEPGMDDAPPSDMDPVTLHYVIGLLQQMLDATNQQGDEGMDPNAAGGLDDMGGGAPDDSQYGGQ